jgi:predicted small lipoprotein YifL
MHARLTTLLLLFAIFALGACGQTGPLYFPEVLAEELPKEPPEKTPVPAPEDPGQPGPTEQTSQSETP